MIDFTKWHNWVGLFVVILVVGFALHTGSQRVAALRPVANASGF